MHSHPPSQPPCSNRLSDAPPRHTPKEWEARRDSHVAISRMVSPEDLSVVFQPIVHLETGQLFAYEALVRCQLPELAYPPALFERALAFGCVGRLGRMIREAAVSLCKSVPLFLNVHPQELNESWLIRPDDPIFGHDHDVFLEITESVPLTHFDRCLVLLREVRSRGGIYLVIDDLGAGYSNLKSIADLEPSVVKLDRDLIAGLDRNQRQRQLVAAVVQLCRELDATVVAEGIETVGEYQAALEAGAQLGQGYLFARPAFPLPQVIWPPVQASTNTDALGSAPAAPAYKPTPA